MPISCDSPFKWTLMLTYVLSTWLDLGGKAVFLRYPLWWPLLAVWSAPWVWRAQRQGPGRDTETSAFHLKNKKKIYISLLFAGMYLFRVRCLASIQLLIVCKTNFLCFYIKHNQLFYYLKVYFSIYCTSKNIHVQLYTLVQYTYYATSILNLNSIYCSLNYNNRKWHYLQLLY
jgi:hypothetical protein